MWIAILFRAFEPAKRLVDIAQRGVDERESVRIGLVALELLVLVGENLPGPGPPACPGKAAPPRDPPQSRPGRPRRSPSPRWPGRRPAS